MRPSVAGVPTTSEPRRALWLKGDGVDVERVRHEVGPPTQWNRRPVVVVRVGLVLDEAFKLAAVEAKVAGARAGLTVATGDRTLLLKQN